MQAPFAELLQKKLIMVTGKGGIGKTLTSVALAYEAQALGKKVCLVESSAHDQLAPLFGSRAFGHQQRELAPGIFVINVNAQDNFRDFVIKHLGFAKLFEKVFTKPIVRSFIQMLPGIAELTLLGRLYYYSELDQIDKFDLVILDGFASGHFQSLMKTPDAVLHSGMVGPVIEETKRVRNFVADPEKVGVLLVTVPEELVVTEAIDFVSRLHRETPAPLAAIALNRCFPNFPAAQSGAAPAALEGGLAYWQSRVAAEAQSTERLLEGLKQFAESEGGRLFPVIGLPERGAFPEPVAAADIHSWIAGAVRL